MLRHADFLSASPLLNTSLFNANGRPLWVFSMLCPLFTGLLSDHHRLIHPAWASDARLDVSTLPHHIQVTQIPSMRQLTTAGYGRRADGGVRHPSGLRSVIPKKACRSEVTT